MADIEWMAVGWGGMVAGVGLIVASTGAGLWRLAMLTAVCLLAGFLAGVRAPDRRTLHAVLAGVAGMLFYVAFAAITWLVDVFGGAAGAGWIPGGEHARFTKILIALLGVTAGGAAAWFRLRPQFRRRRPRA